MSISTLELLSRLEHLETKSQLIGMLRLWRKNVHTENCELCAVNTPRDNNGKHYKTIKGKKEIIQSCDAYLV